MTKEEGREAFYGMPYEKMEGRVPDRRVGRTERAFEGSPQEACRSEPQSEPADPNRARRGASCGSIWGTEKGVQPPPPA